jgi:nitroimidazol reductase NimA-like FMN-containing flavoprotein (pyridoxamine 5'-phosphate oxidase superfamily)
MNETGRAKVKRAPQRGIYEREDIYKILDKEFLCHVAFIHHGAAVAIPTMFGRYKDKIYIHGASISRLTTELTKGIDVCVSVANVSGLVLARSAFHHSLNYESVVIFGKGREVLDKEKVSALKIISDHLIPGRWEEVRLPNAKELKATKVIEIDIIDISGKSRTGDPIDDKEDYDLNIWAGILPIDKKYGLPQPDKKLNENIEISKSIISIRN